MGTMIHNVPMILSNREEAGRLLANRLLAYKDDPKALILALPRGGVPVGVELSRYLHLPLDVFITRKVGAPGNQEFALGAVAETGFVYMNEEILTSTCQDLLLFFISIHFRTPVRYQCTVCACNIFVFQLLFQMPCFRRFFPRLVSS